MSVLTIPGLAVPLDDILTAAFEAKASDVHLTPGLAPVMRLQGRLGPIEGFGPCTDDALRDALSAIISPFQQEKLETELELDFSYHLDVPAVSFRVNLFWHRGSIGAAFRVIPTEIASTEALGLPGVVKQFAGLPNGLVLVCGPTGHGKSTTLAALIDIANRTRSDHIITIEDPIEYLHPSKQCVVAQREVGVDTPSFASALRHALRQDPDIILVGELRDRETMEIALRAAETGHLVFSTVHAQDAGQAISRIVDEFEATHQDAIRGLLSLTLQGIVAQTLCRRADGRGRVVATEVMMATPAVRALLRENKLHQLYTVLHSGRDEGMHTMDQSLSGLVRGGEISYETGLERARHPEEYNRLTGRTARVSQGGAALEHARMGF
jgi:twitching motility protein PilT